ncbi:MAG: RNA polymerase sigma factor [Phycisphaerales bacterium]
MRKTNQYNRFYARAKSLMSELSIKGSVMSADDAAQEAWRRLLEAKRNGKIDQAMGSELAFLYGILRNVGREAVHAQKVATKRIGEASRREDSLDVVKNVLRAERLRVIMICFRELSGREQTALIRARGSLFGRNADCRPNPSDYAAAHRAVKKLRKRVQEMGLME